MVEASADLVDKDFERFERLEEVALHICGMLEPMPRSLLRWKNSRRALRHRVTDENLRGNGNAGIIRTVLISEGLGMTVDRPLRPILRPYKPH